MKDKDVLVMSGEKTARKTLLSMHERALAAGARAQLHEMKGVGHKFPDEEIPVVRGWLRAVVLGAADASRLAPVCPGAARGPLAEGVGPFLGLAAPAPMPLE